ncbi:glutamate 5-kinase [Euryhalocaulis sp.]|uniref:glutamate 5-kinase n=1 Tax=Euryhalocaulis TaxID=1712422 RepID=UPI0003B3ED56|nr:glutamate 5-kinase [Euryhalocaulis sp.]
MTAVAEEYLRGRRCVVKVGSALIYPDGEGPDMDTLRGIAEDIAALRKAGTAVVLVSSGAVAAGRSLMGSKKRPKRLEEKQALAALGQPHLMRAWSETFAKINLRVAQGLLTLDDTENRRRWVNARNTFNRLIRYGAIPIVNEHDTVATDEIRYGDNDRLAARVAQLVSADSLLLLSDIDGMYTANPADDPDARRMQVIEEITPEIYAMAGGPGSSVGTGGMKSKVDAARIATAAGCAVAIAPGKPEHPVTALRNGGNCTWFLPHVKPETARRQWIAHAIRDDGAIIIDEGAETALKEGKSLLPVGITDVKGDFDKGDTVRIENEEGAVLARGLVAYRASDAYRLIGAQSEEIEERLGFIGPVALIHRNDLVLVTDDQS